MKWVSLPSITTRLSSFRKCCVTKANDGTQDCALEYISDGDCLKLRSDSEEFEELLYMAGRAREEASKWLIFYNNIFLFLSLCVC